MQEMGRITRLYQRGDSADPRDYVYSVLVSLTPNDHEIPQGWTLIDSRLVPRATLDRDFSVAGLWPFEDAHLTH
jgi:hypothetical protein